MVKISIEAKVLVFIVNILLRLMRAFPVHDGKVVYWARGLSLYGNASSLCQEWIKKRGTKHVFLVDKASLVHSDVLSGAYFVSLRSIGAIFHLATCKYLIRETDVASPPLYIRPETKVVQLWHAAGAFKKFGLDIHNRSKKLQRYRFIDANRWNMLLCSSESIVNIYSKAFGLKNNKIIYVDGLPRNDNLFMALQINKELKQKYGFDEDKKIILFAPTFRDDHSGGEYFSNLAFSLVEFLSNEYIICVRLHPSCKASVEIPDSVIDVSSIHPLEVLLSFSDILITDYSSIVFDFACLKRQMIFYAPDLNKYVKDRDFYFGYSGFVPGPICREPFEVVDAIKNYSLDQWLEKISDFKKIYNPFFDGKASSRIIEKVTSE